MTEKRSHKITATRIAGRLGTSYTASKGVDIKSPQATVEVRTLETVEGAPGRLRGYKGPVYIAGTNAKAVHKAIEVTKGMTIGVMDERGNIVKPSTRKR